MRSQTNRMMTTAMIAKVMWMSLMVGAPGDPPGEGRTHPQMHFAHGGECPAVPRSGFYTPAELWLLAGAVVRIPVGACPSHLQSSALGCRARSTLAVS